MLTTIDAPQSSTYYDFARGHQDPAHGFGTLHGGDCPGCSRPLYWSNPNVTISGVPSGIPFVRDNLSAMNRVAPPVAAARPSTDPFLSIHDFVQQQYTDVHDPPPPSNLVDFFTEAVLNGSISEGATVEYALDGNGNRFDAFAGTITRLYWAFFQRIPDLTGFQYWLGSTRSGMSADTVAANFATTAEYHTRYDGMNNGQFVTAVYQNTLGRAPDPGGYTYWVGQLDSGQMTRAHVMLLFAESSEGQAARLTLVRAVEITAGMLPNRYAVDAQNLVNSYKAFFDAGASVETMATLTLASADYAARF